MADDEFFKAYQSIDSSSDEPDAPVRTPLKPQPNLRSGEIALPKPEPEEILDGEREVDPESLCADSLLLSHAKRQSKRILGTTEVHPHRQRPPSTSPAISVSSSVRACRMASIVTELITKNDTSAKKHIDCSDWFERTLRTQRMKRQLVRADIRAQLYGDGY